MNRHDGEGMNDDSMSIVGQQARGEWMRKDDVRRTDLGITRAGLSASATGRSRSGLSSTARKSGEMAVVHYCAPWTTRQRRFLW